MGEIVGKLEELIHNKRAQATYQYLVFEGILRCIEKEAKEYIPMREVFKNVAELATKWVNLYGLKLKKEESIANKIVEEETKNVATLFEDDLYRIGNKMMASSMGKWVIPNVTKYEEVFKYDSQNRVVLISKAAMSELTTNQCYWRSENFKQAKSALLLCNPDKQEIIDEMFMKESYLLSMNEKHMKITSDHKDEEIDIKWVQNYMTHRGYEYSSESISNFYLSLKSKPFVILSGISGTGKSKLVRLFANAIGAEFIPIPVRPDWSDATELIGYKDLNQVFHPGSLTIAIQNAKQQPDKPFIVCLDEMNLARVEYYFSDFLSLIESRRKEGDHIITDCFPQDIGDEPLTLPDNLYVVGTVNMDETTFQFSKKVLDRANTIDLSEVDLSYDFDQTFEAEVAPLNVHNNALKSDYLLLKDCKAYKALAEKIITKLIAINEILTPARLEFAYRVRDEIIFYMVYNEEYGLLSEEEAFDLQLLQKILPRITGTSRKVELLLMRLIDLWTDETISIKDLEDTVEDGQVLSKAYYPRSVKKLLQMLRGYRDDGFTSFW